MLSTKNIVNKDVFIENKKNFYFNNNLIKNNQNYWRKNNRDGIDFKFNKKDFRYNKIKLDRNNLDDNNYLSKKNNLEKNNISKNNENHKFVYIKFFKYLKSIEKLTNYFCLKYDKLKKRINRNKKKKIIFNKKIIYFFKNALEGGILKFKFWKVKTEDFIFQINESVNDIDIYEFWNMAPSELKNIYSRIYRNHPYTHIYNLAYRSILIYPYSIKVKPYTIIIRNFFKKRFLYIFEWKNKNEKDFILLKIIKKSKKIFKVKKKVIKILNFNRIESIKRLMIINFNYSYIKPKSNMDLINIRDLTRKRIKFLFWKCENWLWRYRNNFQFSTLRWEFSLNYQYFLLKLFKFNISRINKFLIKPYKFFLKKFMKVIIKKLLKKSKNLVRALKYFKIKKKKKILKFKSKRFKLLKYKYKDFIIKLNKKSPINFFLKIYNLYFYWLIFLMQKFYFFLNQFMFNMYLNFLFLGGFLDLKVNSILLFNNNKANFVNIHYYSNMEEYMSNFYFWLNHKKFYFPDYYYLNNDNNLILDFVTYFNKVKITQLNCLYLKNLQLVYLNNIYKRVSKDFIYLLDYSDENVYSVYLNFKKFIIQTNRFINYRLYNRIMRSPLKKNMININIADHININHMNFLDINLENIDIDKIKFRKMHYNPKLVGIDYNINDICYKNYELFRGDDKRFYYI